MISANGDFPQIRAHYPISFHFGMFGCTRRLCNLVSVQSPLTFFERLCISLTISLTSTRRALAMSALKRMLPSPTSNLDLSCQSSHEDDIEHSPRKSMRNNSEDLDILSHNVTYYLSNRGRLVTPLGSALPSPSRHPQRNSKLFLSQ